MEGLVKKLLTLSRIEAAPALAMNDRIDVPMMLWWWSARRKLSARRNRR